MIDRRKLYCCSYVLHLPYNLCLPTAHWYDCQPNNIIRQCRVRKSCRYAVAWGRENWLLRTCNRVHSFPFSQKRFNLEYDGCLANSKMISAKGSPGLVPRVVAAICRDPLHRKPCFLTHRLQDGAQVLVVGVSIKEPWVLKRGSQNIT